MLCPRLAFSEEQVFADSQVPGRHELPSVFTPERMAGGCTDGLPGTFNPQIQNLSVLVDELCRDEVAVTGVRR